MDKFSNQTDIKLQQQYETHSRIMVQSNLKCSSYLNDYLSEQCLQSRVQNDNQIRINKDKQISQVISNENSNIDSHRHKFSSEILQNSFRSNYNSKRSSKELNAQSQNEFIELISKKESQLKQLQNFLLKQFQEITQNKQKHHQIRQKLNKLNNQIKVISAFIHNQNKQIYQQIQLKKVQLTNFLQQSLNKIIVISQNSKQQQSRSLKSQFDTQLQLKQNQLQMKNRQIEAKNRQIEESRAYYQEIIQKLNLKISELPTNKDVSKEQNKKINQNTIEQLLNCPSDKDLSKPFNQNQQQTHLKQHPLQLSFGGQKRQNQKQLIASILTMQKMIHNQNQKQKQSHFSSQFNNQSLYNQFNIETSKNEAQLYDNLKFTEQINEQQFQLPRQTSNSYATTHGEYTAIHKLEVFSQSQFTDKQKTFDNNETPNEQYKQQNKKNVDKSLPSFQNNKSQGNKDRTYEDEKYSDVALQNYNFSKTRSMHSKRNLNLNLSNSENINIGKQENKFNDNGQKEGGALNRSQIKLQFRKIHQNQQRQTKNSDTLIKIARQKAQNVTNINSNIQTNGIQQITSMKKKPQYSNSKNNKFQTQQAHRSQVMISNQSSNKRQIDLHSKRKYNYCQLYEQQQMKQLGKTQQIIKKYQPVKNQHKNVIVQNKSIRVRKDQIKYRQNSQIKQFKNSQSRISQKKYHLDYEHPKQSSTQRKKFKHQVDYSPKKIQRNHEHYLDSNKISRYSNQYSSPLKRQGLQSGGTYSRTNNIQRILRSHKASHQNLQIQIPISPTKYLYDNQQNKSSRHVVSSSAVNPYYKLQNHLHQLSYNQFSPNKSKISNNYSQVDLAYSKYQNNDWDHKEKQLYYQKINRINNSYQNKILNDPIDRKKQIKQKIQLIKKKNQQKVNKQNNKSDFVDSLQILSYNESQQSQENNISKYQIQRQLSKSQYKKVENRPQPTQNKQNGRYKEQKQFTRQKEQSQLRNSNLSNRKQNGHQLDSRQTNDIYLQLNPDSNILKQQKQSQLNKQSKIRNNTETNQKSPLKSGRQSTSPLLNKNSSVNRQYQHNQNRQQEGDNFKRSSKSRNNHQQELDSYDYKLKSLDSSKKNGYNQKNLYLHPYIQKQTQNVRGSNKKQKILNLYKKQLNQQNEIQQKYIKRF